MLGCLRKVGCLVLLAILAAAAWFSRESWWPRRAVEADSTATEPAIAWEPITEEGAARARRAVEALGRRSGPVFANIRPGDLASYLYIALSKQLPPSAENVEAAVVGDRVYVRATVALRDFKGVESLGPFASFLGERETMQFGGRFGIIRPGLAQFLIEDVKLREFTVPRAAIPRLLRQIRRGARPEGLAETGLPLEVPTYVGDVRAGKGQVTVYKTVR
jgi:hypothetical protein